MLTYLRKIRKPLIDSGSARRYFLYAIGEILLVVIGILIALQINNWNEARKMLKKEIGIYKEIHSELLDTQRDVEDDKSDLERNYRATVLIRNMVIRNQIEEDTFLRYLPYVVDLEQPNPKTSAFESLKSLGLDIITNDTLRQAITTLYQIRIPVLSNSDVAVEFDKTRSKLIRLLEPHIVLDRTKILGQINTDESASYGAFRFLKVTNFEQVLNDESLVLTIHQALSRLRRIIRQYQRAVLAIQRVNNMIEQEIERLE
jgi:hypothetical protein